MALDIDSNALQKGKPGVAERCVLLYDDVLAKLDPSSAAGDERGAIIQFMARTNVASVGQSDVIAYGRLSNRNLPLCFLALWHFRQWFWNNPL